MKKCPKCAEQVQDDAQVCRYCAHKFPTAASGCTTVFGAVFAIAIVIGLVKACSGGSPVANSPATVQTGKVDQAKLDDLLAHPWSYSHDPDNMTSKPVIQASTPSTNSVDFAAPYDGGSVGTLFVRRHPRYGVDVIFMVSKGQIVCDVSDGCPVMVRFDGKPPRRFTAHIPSDYNSKELFLTPSGSFIAALKAAKTVAIEANFYQSGGNSYTFNTQNFHWPPQKADF